MEKIGIYGSKIMWPQKCAACCGEAKKLLTVISSASSVLPLGIVTIIASRRETKIRHPVCFRHFWKCWLASGLSQRHQIYLILGVFSVFSMLVTIGYVYRMFGEQAHEQIGVYGIFSVCFPIIYWTAYFWAKKNTSVRIVKSNMTNFAIAFNNDDYAYEFLRANPGCKIEL